MVYHVLQRFEGVTRLKIVMLSTDRFVDNLQPVAADLTFAHRIGMCLLVV